MNEGKSRNLFELGYRLLAAEAHAIGGQRMGDELLFLVATHPTAGKGQDTVRRQKRKVSSKVSSQRAANQPPSNPPNQPTSQNKTCRPRVGAKNLLKRRQVRKPFFRSREK
jgi:hypothetical protein